jgi:hypothetical protein
MATTELARSTTTSATDLSYFKDKEDDRSAAPSISSPPAEQQPDVEKAAEPPTVPPEENIGNSRKYKGWQWAGVLAALYCSAFLYGLDTTIAADIQAPIVETFGDVAKLGWIGIGFPLGSIATILPIGKAFGIFDLKW